MNSALKILTPTIGNYRCSDCEFCAISSSNMFPKNQVIASTQILSLGLLISSLTSSILTISHLFWTKNFLSCEKCYENKLGKPVLECAAVTFVFASVDNYINMNLSLQVRTDLHHILHLFTYFRGHQYIHYNFNNHVIIYTTQLETFEYYID